MIVDDDPDAVDIVALVVSELGCECRTATSSAEALQLAASYQPHMAILDLSLGAASGATLAMDLRRELDRRPFLVAFTGSSRRSDDLLAVGFDAHLEKPGTIAGLRQLVARAASHAARC
jgi:CheY-like chemotaxis protein